MDLLALKKRQEQGYKTLQQRLQDIDKQKSGMSDFFSKVVPKAQANMNEINANLPAGVTMLDTMGGFNTALSNATARKQDLNNESASIWDSIQKMDEANTPTPMTEYQRLQLEIDANKSGQQLVLDPETGQLTIVGGEKGDVRTIVSDKVKSATAKKQLAEYQDYVTELQGLQNDLAKIRGGKTGQGYGETTTGLLGALMGQVMGTPEEKAYRNRLENFRAKVRKGLYGSVLTKQEIKEGNKLLPSASRQEQTNQIRIDTQLNEKVSSMKNLLMTYDIDPATADEYVNEVLNSASNSQMGASNVNQGGLSQEEEDILNSIYGGQ